MQQRLEELAKRSRINLSKPFEVLSGKAREALVEGVGGLPGMDHSLPGWDVSVDRGCSLRARHILAGFIGQFSPYVRAKRRSHNLIQAFQLWRRAFLEYNPARSPQQPRYRVPPLGPRIWQINGWRILPVGRIGVEVAGCVDVVDCGGILEEYDRPWRFDSLEGLLDFCGIRRQAQHGGSEDRECAGLYRQ